MKAFRLGLPMTITVLLLAAACGDRGIARTEPYRWVTYQAEVTAVRPATDPRAVLIDVRVPGGAPDCARDPRASSLEETPDRVYATVVVDSLRAQRAGGCPATVPATVTLITAAPIGDRKLVLNSGSSLWAPTERGYRSCTGPFGCEAPPEDHCHPDWIHVAVDGLDVPRHSDFDVRHCDPEWLIVDVNTAAGECGPVEGQRPGCSAAPRITRWFLRFDGSWQVVATTTEPGCPDVPALPARLCEGLPAPR